MYIAFRTVPFSFAVYSLGTIGLSGAAGLLGYLDSKILSERNQAIQHLFLSDLDCIHSRLVVDSWPSFSPPLSAKNTRQVRLD